MRDDKDELACASFQTRLNLQVLSTKIELDDEDKDYREHLSLTASEFSSESELETAAKEPGFRANAGLRICLHKTLGGVSAEEELAVRQDWDEKLTEHGYGVNSAEDREKAIKSRFKRNRKEAIDETIRELEDLDEDFVRKSLEGSMYRGNSDAESLT